MDFNAIFGDRSHRLSKHLEIQWIHNFFLGYSLHYRSFFSPNYVFLKRKCEGIVTVDYKTVDRRKKTQHLIYNSFSTIRRKFFLIISSPIFFWRVFEEIAMPIHLT